MCLIEGKNFMAKKGKKIDINTHLENQGKLAKYEKKIKS